MKTITTILFLIVSLISFSQKKVAEKIEGLNASGAYFELYSVLDRVADNLDPKISKVVKNATLATIRMQAVADLFVNKDEYIEINIPYNGTELTLQLYRSEIFSPGFHADTDKQVAVPYEPGVYYRGIIKGDFNSLVSFNFFRNELNGVISGQSLGNVVVGKIAKAGNVSDYIIYSDTDMNVAQNFECHTAAVSSQQSISNRALPLAESKCISLYFELGNDVYEANGSNMVQTLNWFTAVFNSLQTVFLNDGIDVSLKSVYVWTSTDPYNGSSAQNLTVFQNHRTSFDGDAGQLLVLGVSTSGVAFASTLCNPRAKYATSTLDGISDIDGSGRFIGTVKVIAHEFGHVFGSSHTHECVWNGNNTAIDGCASNGGGCPNGPIPPPRGGSIMSYCWIQGFNLSNGFGPQPAARIRDFINGRSCLGSNCPECVNTITAVNAACLAPNSITVKWQVVSSPSNVQVSVVKTGNAPVWIPILAPPYTVTGLLENVQYTVDVRIHRDCGNGLYPVGMYRKMMFVIVASGLQVYDTTTRNVWLYNGSDWGSKPLSSSLPIYINNTAAEAGGIAVGAFYKTPAGVLMIRY